MFKKCKFDSSKLIEKIWVEWRFFKCPGKWTTPNCWRHYWHVFDFFYYSKKCDVWFIHHVKNVSLWIHKMIDSNCPQASLSIIRSVFNLIEQLLPHFFIHRHIHQKVIQTSNGIFVKNQSYYHGSKFIKNVILFSCWNLSEL